MSNVISLFQAAHHDFSHSVKADPYSYAKLMLSKDGRHWFPQHPIYLPAYQDFFDDPDRLLPWSCDRAMICAAESLAAMGSQAAPMIPTLESIVPRLGIFVTRPIQRISKQFTNQPVDEWQALLDRVEKELQIYPTSQDRFDLEHPLTVEDVKRGESELIELLDDNNWAVRAKAACILRCKVQNPRNKTVLALFRHLGQTERRGNVRGQCILGLAGFAKSGRLNPLTNDDLDLLPTDELVTGLLVRLKNDRASPVRGIAGKALPVFTPAYTMVIPALVSALAESQEVNLTRDLVQALGNCGPPASEALPLIPLFKPHGNDSTGELVKAVAIFQIAPVDYQEAQKSFATILKHLRWQPIGASVSVPRERRDAALTALLSVPINETLRLKLILERMIFDESARIRCLSAQALIDIDKEFARNAGAYLVLDSIRCM